MAEFYFNCPFCKKEIKADTEWIGQSAECPHCSNTLVINKPQNTSKKTQLLPKLSVADTQKGNGQPKIINCPDCNKEMSARAANCPHCGAPNEAAPQPKQRIIYVLLGLFLGGWGAHNFYARETGGIIHITLSICGAAAFVFAPMLRDEAIATFGLAGGGLMLANVIWVLAEICTHTKDGDGVPFK